LRDIIIFPENVDGLDAVGLGVSAVWAVSGAASLEKTGCGSVEEGVQVLSWRGGCHVFGFTSGWAGGIWFIYMRFGSKDV